MTSLCEQAQGISKYSHNDKMLPPNQTFILIFDSTIPALKKKKIQIHLAAIKLSPEF